MRCLKEENATNSQNRLSVKYPTKVNEITVTPRSQSKLNVLFFQICSWVFPNLNSVKFAIK